MQGQNFLQILRYTLTQLTFERTCEGRIFLGAKIPVMTPMGAPQSGAHTIQDFWISFFWQILC